MVAMAFSVDTDQSD